VIHSGQQPTFSSLLSLAQWSALVQSGVRRTFLPGDELLRQGDLGGYLFAMVQGRVHVTYHQEDGTQVLVAVRGAGDLIGEFAAQDDGRRSATVVALDPCYAYRLRADEFRSIVSRDRLEGAVVTYTTWKIRQQAEYSAALVHLRGTARIARLLLWIVDAAGPKHPDPLTVNLTRTSIAALLGLSLSSTKSAVAELRELNLVRTDHARLTVLDVPGLRKISPGNAM
jgi:CRP-like cAMP-binding protein